MPNLQISLEVDADRCPQVEAVLEELGALAISNEDPGGDPVLEPAVGENPLWARVRVVGLFPDDVDAASLRAVLAETLATEPEGWRVEELADQCWERAWMDQFRPMRFGRRLWVCPTNQEPPEPEAVNLRLDPGLAFGTGTHPTTALCLRWLDRISLNERTVIDYGCGSGILGVAALLLGARRCLAVDNDPQALLASRENAERNGVAGRLAVYGPEQLPAVEADVLVANILAGILIELAPVIAERVRAGGLLALSGILDHQAADVAAAFEPWFELSDSQQEAEWVLLQGRRR